MSMKFKIAITALLIGIASTSISYLLFPKIRFFENYIYGLTLQFRTGKDKEIVLVLIGDSSIQKKGPYPFKRSEYAKVIAHILKGRPKVIGVDIFFDGIRELEDDMKLIETLEKADTNIVLAVYSTTADNLIINRVKSLPTFSSNEYPNVGIGDVVAILKGQGGGITKFNAIPFIDRKCGREILPFPIVVVGKYLSADYKQKSSPKGSVAVMLGDIEIPNPTDVIIDFLGGAESFETIAFEEVVETDPSIYRDKIVLIGVSAEDGRDNFTTPLSKKTPGVVIHANVIHTIISKRFISEIQVHYQAIPIFFISFLISLFAFYVRPIFSLLISVLLIAVFKFFADFIFAKYCALIFFTPFLSAVLFSYLGTLVCIMLSRKPFRVAASRFGLIGKRSTRC